MTDPSPMGEQATATAITPTSPPKEPVSASGAAITVVTVGPENSKPGHGAQPERRGQSDPKGQDRRGVRDTDVSGQLLRIGTYGAIVLVFACLFGACALCWKVVTSSFHGAQDELLIRLLLSCIVCFIGMGFACLGFGLFLIQAQGTFNADLSDSAPSDPGARRWARLATNAPGLVVVVCATVIIALALNVSWDRTVTTGAPSSMAPAGLNPAADGVVMPEGPPAHASPAARSEAAHPEADGVQMPTMPVNDAGNPQPSRDGGR